MLFTSSVQACSEPAPGNYHALLFRASLPNMKSMQPFTYTVEHLYYRYNEEMPYTDYYQNDRYRNCMEWKAICNSSVTIDDIYKIQYDTDGNLFISTYQKDTWQENFENNTFIRFLTKKENKDLLDYMLFAKKVELTEIKNSSRFEEWESECRYGEYYFERDEMEDIISIKNTRRQLLNDAWIFLQNSSSVFLQQRYAFQVCRLRYQVKNVKPEIAKANIFDKYFGNVKPDNLMSIWAGLFHALSFPAGEADYYRYLIRVFANSDEKKLRCVQLFDDLYTPETLTNKELSIAMVMTAIRYPGRAIDMIRRASALDPENPYIPFLILREINKLEDWLITPLFYSKYYYFTGNVFECADPPELPDQTSEMERIFQDENAATDREYVEQLKLLLNEFLPKAQGETKDFYAISLAHLSLLQENIGDSHKYSAMVSPNANVSIRLQKSLEAAWIAIKTQDINSLEFKNTFLQNITAIEQISTPNYENNQLLYTLTLSLADEYLKKGNRVYGNLMRMKSDMYRWKNNEWGESMSAYYYHAIAYFDRNATIQDMDKVLALLEKKNKNDFEQFLCRQPLGTIDIYKDLKGTIAFRNNDLPLAYATFASMPDDYWQKNNPYPYCLNEDPFVPKGLMSNKYRHYDYVFNKAAFVNELLNLQKQLEEKSNRQADIYIRLGNAFYNTSFWGNAWMMTHYGWSINNLYHSEIDCLPQWMIDYMTAGIACNYFEKALQKADNEEQRAYASLMLFFIHKCCSEYRETEQENKYALQYLNRFMQYNKTTTFKIYECPGIKWFLKYYN
jgi:hypothetical protein